MKQKETSRAAVIDIGSNSIKLFIAEKATDSIKIIESLKNFVPLGMDSFTKERISQESINRTISILEKYKDKLKEYLITNVKVIATTAIREGLNRDLFIDTVNRRTGFEVEVLSVGDVVYYIDGYLHQKLKDRYPIYNKNLVIAELGSGSLDISFMSKGYILFSVGLPLGVLRIKQLMSRLDGSLEENYEAIREHIECEFSYLKREMPPIEIDDIILIDETYSVYLPKILPIEKSENFFLILDESNSTELVKKITARNIEDIAKEYKIPLENVDALSGYAIILDTFLKLAKNRNIYILDVPLAEAVLADMLLDFEISQKYNKTNQLLSIANAICKKFNADLKHCQQVANLSELLFDGLKDTLGLKKTDLLYLLLASYLHDIGLFIYNRAHHKHTEYIVSNLNLFRLTNEEIKIIACVSRYHRKGIPLESHPLYNSLSKDRQVLVQKLSAILRMANALDRSHKQKVKKIEIKFNRDQYINLTVFVTDNFLIEKIDFLEKKEMFEDISGYKIHLSIQYAQ